MCEKNRKNIEGKQIFTISSQKSRRKIKKFVWMRWKAEWQSVEERDLFLCDWARSSKVRHDDGVSHYGLTLTKLISPPPGPGWKK